MSNNVKKSAKKLNAKSEGSSSDGADTTVIEPIEGDSTETASGVVKSTRVEINETEDGHITKTLKQEAHFVESENEQIDSTSKNDASDINSNEAELSDDHSLNKAKLAMQAENTKTELDKDAVSVNDGDSRSKDAVAGILSGLGVAGARASTEDLKTPVVDEPEQIDGPQENSLSENASKVKNKITETVSQKTDAVSRKFREHVDVHSVQENITSGQHWMRFLYMVLFAVALYFVPVVYLGLIVTQGLVALFRGEPSMRIREFSSTLNQFVFQALEFLVYNSDKKPFPFSEWPESKLSDTSYANDDLIDENLSNPKTKSSVIITPDEVR